VAQRTNDMPGRRQKSGAAMKQVSTERARVGSDRKQGSSERAYELIRAAIVEGRYHPGQRIVEQRVSEEFEISRTPVREALHRLEAEGLVISERNRGAIVRPITMDDIYDLYEVRARLESLAAERAAKRVGAEDLVRLDDAIALFAASIPSGDTHDPSEVYEIHRANARFHRHILRMARHERLSQLLALTIDIPLIFQGLRVLDREERLRSNLFHELIRNAVASGDSDRAGRLMCEHILIGRDALLDRLDLTDGIGDLFKGLGGATPA
jgi:DNA-binding GntR family transcriptional regulator